MASITKLALQRDITDILKGADLSTLSAKKIRKQLEEKYGQDLTDRKSEIDSLVMEAITASKEEQDDNSDEDTHQNGAENYDDSDSEFDEPEDTEPRPKKAKKFSKSSREENDEELAKRLQAEEDEGLKRTRGGRGGSAKKTPSGKRKGSEGGGKKGQGYMKECVLSAELAEIMGTDKMARSEVVKKMWEIIRARNLQDPKNKQFMICDDELLKIFGRRRVRTFGMMKYLKEHINPEDSL